MIDNASPTVGTTRVVQPQPAPDQLESERRSVARIKRAIRRKTSGGVQDLIVEIKVGTLRLRGHCASFYCKQVAQQAAMSFLPGEAIINDIEVDVRPR